MIKMTETIKRKANNIGLFFYRGVLTVGVLTLVFNGGVWKNDIEHYIKERAFKDSEEKYKALESIKSNTVHRLDLNIHMPKSIKDSLYVSKTQYDTDMNYMKTTLKRIEKKIDNN